MHLYSPEWVVAFNEAVAELVPEPGVSFRMHQIVEGGPEGTLRVILAVGMEGGTEEGGMEVGTEDGGELGGPGAPDGERAPRGGPGIVLRVERGEGAGTAFKLPATGRHSQVVVVVAYDDAAALARGELDPASLLRAGRVKVRGDLSSLVAGQKILAEAAARLGSLSERTTF